MNNKSKQVQDLRYLYESIYNQQPDTNLEELKLCAELYNIFLEKGLIEGNFISEEELYENVANIASGIHKGINLIKGITGFGAKRTTQAGNIGKNLQKLATGAGVGVAADRTGLVDRTGAGLQGFAQQFSKDPKKKNQFADSFDVFDAIKGHLLDEGYADTEEAALAIMANMSEDWRQSIVEAGGAIRADVPQPGQRTVRMTATGKEPAGDRFVRQAGETIGRFLGSRGVQKIEPAPPQRKPLGSTTKPGPSNNFGRGF